MKSSTPPGANKSLSNLTNPGTSGHVLTSNGAGAAPTFQAPAAAAATPKAVQSTDFAASGRYTLSVSGGGANTFDNSGTNQSSSAASGGAKLLWQISLNGYGFTGSPSLSISLGSGNNGTDFQSFHGLGGVTLGAGGLTYTLNHIGFKITRASSGAMNLYATQADGTTENASASLTTFGDDLDLFLKVNGTSSVDYYWRRAGGAWSSATNLTTNLPTAANSCTDVAFAVSNTGVASLTRIYCHGATYSV